MEHEVRAVLERPEKPRRGEGRVDGEAADRARARARRRAGCRARRAPDCRASRRTASASPAGSPRATRRCRADRRTSSRCRSAAACTRAGCASRRTATRDATTCAPAPMQRRDREMQRRLPARRRDRADAAFERGDALLQHRAGRVGDARIDVSRALHVEQRRGVVGVRQHERRRLVDRRRPRAGRGIGRSAGVQRQRVELMRPGLRHGASRRLGNAAHMVTHRAAAPCDARGFG